MTILKCLFLIFLYKPGLAALLLHSNTHVYTTQEPKQAKANPLIGKLNGFQAG